MAAKRNRTPSALQNLSPGKQLCLTSDRILCAYIQIPFCRSLCSFCCWRQHYNPGEILRADKYRTQYIQALKEEITGRSSIPFERDQVGLNVIHFGGGTPSLFHPEELAEILQHLLCAYHMKKDAVQTIGIEVRQDDLSAQYLSALRDIGFNRISIGAQSFDRNILKKLGRGISPEDFFQAYDRIRAAGFSDVNIDLLYGFAIQGTEQIRSDAETLVRLGPDHIDAHPWKEVDGCLPGITPEYAVEKDKKIQAARFMRTCFADAGYENYNHRCFCTSGRENLMHLIEAAYSLPFIAFGAGSEQYRMARTACAVEDYIQKPFDRDRFEQDLQKRFTEFNFLNCADSLFRQLLLPEGVYIPFFNRTQACDLTALLNDDCAAEKYAPGCVDVYTRSRIQIYKKVQQWLRDGVIEQSGEWLRLKDEFILSPQTWVLYMQAC